MTNVQKPEALFTTGKVYHQAHDYESYMSTTQEQIDMTKHVILAVPTFPSWLARELDTMVKNWTADMNVMTLTSQDDGLLRQDRFKEWCQQTFEGASLAEHYDAGVKAVMVALVTGQYKIEPLYFVRKTDAFMEQAKESHETRYLAVGLDQSDFYTFTSREPVSNGSVTTCLTQKQADEWISQLSSLGLERVLCE